MCGCRCCPSCALPTPAGWQRFCPPTGSTSEREKTMRRPPVEYASATIGYGAGLSHGERNAKVERLAPRTAAARHHLGQARRLPRQTIHRLTGSPRHLPASLSTITASSRSADAIPPAPRSDHARERPTLRRGAHHPVNITVTMPTTERDSSLRRGVGRPPTPPPRANGRHCKSLRCSTATGARCRPAGFE